MNFYSIVKLLPVAFVLFELCHAQKIPQEFRTKCTVAENEWCFTNSTKSSCPPGYHRNHHYTDCSPRRHCCPCPQGTFQPDHNFCNSCIECKNCSKTNQEVSIRCNVTHDTKCGDTIPTDIPEAFIPDELPGEEETVLPEYTPPPEEDPTTEAPENQGKAAVVCPPPYVFILSHAFCVLIGIFLCNIGCILQKIKSCFSVRVCTSKEEYIFDTCYEGRITTHRASYSLEEGKSKPRKKKGTNYTDNDNDPKLGENNSHNGGIHQSHSPVTTSLHDELSPVNVDSEQSSNDGSESNNDDEEQSATNELSARGVRQRRPPAWMKDYYVGELSQATSG